MTTPPATFWRGDAGLSLCLLPFHLPRASPYYTVSHFLVFMPHDGYGTVEELMALLSLPHTPSAPHPSPPTTHCHYYSPLYQPAGWKEGGGQTIKKAATEGRSKHDAGSCERTPWRLSLLGVCTRRRGRQAYVKNSDNRLAGASPGAFLQLLATVNLVVVFYSEFALPA